VANSVDGVVGIGLMMGGEGKSDDDAPAPAIDALGNTSDVADDRDDNGRKDWCGGVWRCRTKERTWDDESESS